MALFSIYVIYCLLGNTYKANFVIVAEASWWNWDIYQSENFHGNPERLNNCSHLTENFIFNIGRVYLDQRFGFKFSLWNFWLKKIWGFKKVSVPCATHTAQKIKFSIKDVCSKCDQIRRLLRIWSHLLKKSLMENFIFCAVQLDNVEETLSKRFFQSCMTNFEHIIVCLANDKTA